MNAGDLHPLFQDAFNTCDADAVAALYEEDADIVGSDGVVARGREAIRRQNEETIARGATFSIVTRYAVELGDIALLSNDFRLVAPGFEFSSRTAEVARRQADGTWKFVIDHATGGANLSFWIARSAAVLHDARLRAQIAPLCARYVTSDAAQIRDTRQRRSRVREMCRSERLIWVFR